MSGCGGEGSCLASVAGLQGAREGPPQSSTQWPLALACQMLLPLFGARWPKGCVSHDSGAWVQSANGWTPMGKVPPLEDEHVPRGASKNHMFAIRGEECHELLADMVMTCFTRGTFCGDLVAARPNIKGAIRQ